jgi:glutathione S-transferase
MLSVYITKKWNTPMIKLYGFGSSNYFNIVKHALLYKGIEFEEVKSYPGASADYLQKSPLGKVPCIETEYGFLSETTAILDYIEETYPQKSLYPIDVFAKAKVKELMKIGELYLELSARTLLPGVLMRIDSSDEKKRDAKMVLNKGVTAMSQLVSFSPYIAGRELTMADIYMRQVMSVTAMVCDSVFKWDIAADITTMPAWLEMMDEMDICQQIDADKAEDLPAFGAHIMKLVKG